MSANFEWNDDFSIGVEEIDYQHKRFLAFIRKINECKQARAETSEIHELLKELEKYLLFHTRSEEFMMELYSYPGLQEQQEEHDRIIEQVRRKIDTIQMDEEQLTELLSYLYEWLESHLTTLDKDFGAHVRQQRGGLSKEPGLA